MDRWRTFQFGTFVLLVVSCGRLATAELQLNQHSNDHISRLTAGTNAGNLAAIDHAAGQAVDQSQYGDVVQELANRLQKLQVKKDRPYLGPMVWKEDRGLYPSEIRINFAGDPTMEMIRDSLGVFDNNMFATAWITISLLEAHFYAKAPRPTDAQLSMALEAIAQYHDHNRNYNNSIMNFWPQAYNQTTQTWVSTPENLVKSFDFFDSAPTKVIEEFLKLLGLKDIEKFLEDILSMKSVYLRAFQIPPDFDDSFVNLGLGAMLKDLSKDLPAAHSQWVSKNDNLTSLTDALRRYAYRPFSKDNNLNTIDVRTYYYMRFFLEEAAARKEDIALVPTWIQNLDEARVDYYKGVAMPFQMNNVDVTVAANTIYGLTSAILSGILPASALDDPTIKQVYLNTSTMIAHQINHNLYDRPDLELTYYPSKFEFYWFVARTFSRMELAPRLPQVMQEVYNSLKPALQNTMTSDILKKAKRQGDSMLFFDDFLGDEDVNRKNHTEVKGEDRLFTTAVAVNALLTTWTVFDPASRTNHWRPGTPWEVKDTVTKSCTFVGSFILGDTYKPWNVFFSGSEKSRSSMPFAYPSNRREFLNGTSIPDDSHFPKTKEPFFIGMKGLTAESEYQQMLKQKHFGMNTPLNFTTYNEPGNFFPFWSSPAYTYANSMLALARFDNIVG